MQITFVGGPWHGESKQYPDPLPPMIEAPDRALYVPWDSHPSTAGVLAEPVKHSATYVLQTLEAPELLKRVEDILLHGPLAADGIGAASVNHGGPLP